MHRILQRKNLIAFFNDAAIAANDVPRQQDQ
jgi:hypothetical protein